MDASSIVELGTGVGAIITGFSVIVSLFYLHNQNRNERILSDERWSAIMTKTDESIRLNLYLRPVAVWRGNRRPSLFITKGSILKSTQESIRLSILAGQTQMIDFKSLMIVSRNLMIAGQLYSNPFAILKTSIQLI